MFPTNSKILIIDDMMTMRRLVKKALISYGYEDITEAKDGQQAWGLVQENNFDLIISDWNMPKMTGLELLKHVRGAEAYAQTPFILLTAEADTDQMQEATDAGVDNYITKPFSKEILSEKLQETFSKKNTTAQAA